MKPLLRDFLVQCIQERPNLSRFIELRYYVMADLFPHGTFSVAQASPDFFSIALAHLDGAPFEHIENPSVYERNYRDWIRSHRSTKL